MSLCGLSVSIVADCGVSGVLRSPLIKKVSKVAPTAPNSSSASNTSRSMSFSSACVLTRTARNKETFLNLPSCAYS